MWCSPKFDTVLGPLLALTFVNDLNNSTKVLDSVLSADDTNLQWNLSKADTYGTKVFVRFREVSALERFELKSFQI